MQDELSEVNGQADARHSVSESHDAVRFEKEVDLEVAEQVRTLMIELKRSGLTDRALAKEVGVSSGVVNMFVNGRVLGRKALSQFISWSEWRQRNQPRRAPGEPEWVETETGRQISAALAFAQAESSIALVYGGAGLGKTTAITRYADENENVWVATSSPTRSGVLAMLSVLLDTLGMRGLPRTPYDMSRDVAQRLMGVRGLLVIDEAQHLTLEALEELRAIHDLAAVGLCLSGNEAVYSKMTGGNRKAVFAQMFSRVGRRVSLRSPRDEDVDAILSAWGVDGAQERDYGRMVASMPGGLRGLTQVLREAGLVSHEQSLPIEIKTMRWAWRELGGE
jgi:DNA transposition AAA+ family ATPase